MPAQNQWQKSMSYMCNTSLNHFKKLFQDPDPEQISRNSWDPIEFYGFTPMLDMAHCGNKI